MMKLSKAYINSHDIDWFAFYEGKYIHVASAGGLLPQIVNDRTKLRFLQKYVKELPLGNHEIVKNIKQVISGHNLSEEQLDDYFESFENMAKKGFYSYDKVDINDTEDNKYILVAYPKEPINIKKIEDLDFPNLSVTDECFKVIE